MVAALCPVKRASIVTTALLQPAQAARGSGASAVGRPGAAAPRACQTCLHMSQLFCMTSA